MLSCPGSIPQQLQWLESECDTFLTEHTQMGDSVAMAEELKTQYETFLETIEVSLDQECILGPYSNLWRGILVLGEKCTLIVYEGVTWFVVMSYHGSLTSQVCII